MMYTVVNIRAANIVEATKIMTARTPIKVGIVLGGLIKFGVTPGGGSNAGGSLRRESISKTEDLAPSKTAGLRLNPPLCEMKEIQE